MKNDHGGNVAEISRRYGIAEDKIIDFSANINPLGYPTFAKVTAIREFDSILNYPDIASFDLVSALSEYHGIDGDHILAGNGSTEFIYWLPMVFRPGKALIVAPAFSEYERGLRVINSQVSYCYTEEKTGFTVDTSALCSRLREGFDILYFCNPANPTGVLTSKDELCKVIACAMKSGTIAVVDEAFIDFVEEESIKKEIFRFSNLIVLRSMTKFFGIPGLRVGYLMASTQCISKIREVKPPWMVNTLGQKVAACAVLDSDYIRDTRRYVTIGRKVLRDSIDGTPGLKTYGSSANFVFVSMDRQRLGLNSTGLRDRLIQEGILIRDCSNFQGLDDHYFRIAVKKHEENSILIGKLKEILMD